MHYQHVPWADPNRAIGTTFVCSGVACPLFAVVLRVIGSQFVTSRLPLCPSSSRTTHTHTYTRASAISRGAPTWMIKICWSRGSGGWSGIGTESWTMCWWALRHTMDWLTLVIVDSTSVPYTADPEGRRKLEGIQKKRKASQPMRRRRQRFPHTQLWTRYLSQPRE
jgi:hypothetical protein